MLYITAYHSINKSIKIITPNTKKYEDDLNNSKCK